MNRVSWLCCVVVLAAPVSTAKGQPGDVGASIAGIEDVLTGVAGYTPTEVPSPPGEALVLDLRRCVELAMDRNAQALIAAEAVLAKRAQAGQARALRRPLVKTRAGYMYIRGLDQDISVSPLSGLFVDAAKFEAEKGTFTTEFLIEQVLYAGGQIKAGIDASKYLAESEDWKRQAALDQLEYEAKQAFYDCLLATALARVAQDSVTTFERHKADAEQMLEVGLVSHFEVLRAQTELSARQAGLESALSAEKIAMLNLRRILAMPADHPLRLEGKLEWTPITEPAEALVAAAFEQRAELKALQSGIAAARSNVSRARGGYKPKIAASAQWQNVDGGGSFMPDGWTFSVGAEWELYTGGGRKHALLEAEAQLRNIEYQRDDVLRLVELDVRQAYIRFQEAIAKIRKENDTVALGREGLRLAQLRFQEGIGTQGEALDAELALTQARTALTQALRDYAVAIAALDKAVGCGWASGLSPVSE